MTKAEAREYIREVENLSPSEIDYDKLEEAVRVLGGDDPVLNAVQRLGEIFAQGGLIGGDSLLSTEDVQQVVEQAASSLRQWMTESERPEFVPDLSAKGFTDEDREALQTATDILSNAAQTAASESGAEYVPFQTGFESAVTSQEGISGQPLKPADSGLRRRAIEAALAAGLSPQEAEQAVNQTIQQVEEARRWAEETGQPPPPWMPTDPDAALEQQIAIWEEESKALRGAPIGVPENFVAQRAVPTEDPRGGSMAWDRLDPTRQDTFPVEPRYFVGDQFSLAGLPPEQIAETQARMVEAGLLGEDEFYAGFWDSQTAQAYTSVLGWANQRGTTADEALDDLVANVPESVKEQRNREKLADQFQSDPYIKPDYSTLEQETKAMFRQKVGREPTETEMAEFTNYLAGLYRQDFQADQAYQRSAFEAQQESLETGEAAAPVAVSDVDKVAAFNSFAEQRLGAEMDFIEDQAARFETSRRVMNTLTSLNRRITR